MNEFISYKLRAVFHGHKYITWSLHFWGGWDNMWLVNSLAKNNEKSNFESERTVETTRMGGAETLEGRGCREVS